MNGPDLERVANKARLTVDEVAEIHQSVSYSVRPSIPHGLIFVLPKSAARQKEPFLLNTKYTDELFNHEKNL